MTRFPAVAHVVKDEPEHDVVLRSRTVRRDYGRCNLVFGYQNYSERRGKRGARVLAIAVWKV